MGKRKHRNKDPDEIRRKIRRLKRQLDERTRKDRDQHSSDDHYESEYSRHTPNSVHSIDESSPDQEYHSDMENYHVRSAVTLPESTVPADKVFSVEGSTIAPVTSAPAKSDTSTPNMPNTNGANPTAEVTATDLPALPDDILQALGESKEKDEVFGPKVREEISKRWGKIIMEGLSKDQRNKLIENTLIPENFQILKAPKLNPEISVVLSESTRNRDKRLENAQNHLGIGIASVTNLMSSLIEADMDKKEIIKKLSETGQILLDLHCQDTLARRKLITYSLDKKFTNIVQGVKRDSFLFGENLGEKIKASKTTEKSGLQIKRTFDTQPSTSSSYRSNRPAARQQGNARGPPKQQAPRSKQGGPRPQSSTQASKRPAPAPDRYTTSTRSSYNNKSSRKTH